MTTLAPPVRVIPGLADRVRSIAFREIDRIEARDRRRASDDPRAQLAASERARSQYERVNWMSDQDIARLAPAALAHPLSLYPGRDSLIDNWQKFNDALAPVITTKFLNEWASNLIHSS